METSVKEVMLSIMIPSDLKYELDDFVFKKRQSERPYTKTTLKNTAILAIREFLSNHNEE